MPYYNFYWLNTSVIIMKRWRVKTTKWSETMYFDSINAKVK